VTAESGRADAARGARGAVDRQEVHTQAPTAGADVPSVNTRVDALRALGARPGCKAWLLLALGDDRQYGGNEGYEDQPDAIYGYDSLVQNSRQIVLSDVVVLRDRDGLLGVGVVEEIRSRAGAKVLRRCPDCRTTKIRRRAKLSPPYRCAVGHRFSTPFEDTRDCVEFEARFAKSWRSCPGAVPLGSLRDACRRHNNQLSMQQLDVTRLGHLLGTAPEFRRALLQVVECAESALANTAHANSAQANRVGLGGEGS
jgi:hypothetical protein